MEFQRADELPREYDALAVGIALYDPETGGILDTNDQFESIMRYPVDRLREISIERYTGNTYSYSEADFIDRLRASAAGDPQRFNWRIKRGDGELIWARIRLSQFSGGRQERVFAEIRDITDYYDTSHRAELFWRLLRHNLRNEATVIRGNATQIRDDTKSEDVSTAAETIQARATELGNIAESVKEIEQAVDPTDTQRVYRNVADAVEQVATTVRTDHPSAEITIEEQEEMWTHVNEAFRAALTHGLENAIIHNEKTDPLVEVEIGPSPNTGRIDVQISDRNPPIPDAEIDPLFDHEETTSTFHGSGVGLFVMKWCVESLGGEIEFEKRTPKGNAIHYYLPPQDRHSEQHDSHH
jgi:PAS domain S-box-containing protein